MGEYKFSNKIVINFKCVVYIKWFLDYPIHILSY